MGEVKYLELQAGRNGRFLCSTGDVNYLELQSRNGGFLCLTGGGNSSVIVMGVSFFEFSFSVRIIAHVGGFSIFLEFSIHRPYDLLRLRMMLIRCSNSVKKLESVRGAHARFEIGVLAPRVRATRRE